MARTFDQPIIELIAQDVVKTLNAVDKAKGYHIALTAERAEPGGNNQTHGRAVVVVTTVAPGEAPVNGQDDWLATVTVSVCVREPLATGIAIDTTMHVIAADVAKALCVDRYRCGYAYWTEAGASEITELDTQNNVGLVQQTLEIRFRTLLGDPFSSPAFT